MSTITIVILSVSAILLLWMVSIYNELTKERILVQEGFSGVDAGLQQRFDLIPNLVETVKGYAGHENKTLTDVIALRNRGLKANSNTEKVDLDATMTRALADVFALSENYPDLKANANFLALQGSLEKIEGELNYARRYYNGTVREYNQSIAVFPKNLIAGIFGFNAEKFFQAEEGSQSAPKVNF